MHPSIALAVFPLIFLGELPDKTMFASLALSARGRAFAVWVGASVAFAAHVALAVTVGAVLVHLVPHRVLQVVVAVAFIGGAVYAYRSRAMEEDAELRVPVSALRTVLLSAAVVAVAEWGDLTQVLTIDLAARYHSPVSVGVGALAALVVVAGLAVVAGRTLLRRVPVRALRVVMAAVLLALGTYSLVAAA